MPESNTEFEQCSENMQNRDTNSSSGTVISRSEKGSNRTSSISTSNHENSDQTSSISSSNNEKGDETSSISTAESKMSSSIFTPESQVNSSIFTPESQVNSSIFTSESKRSDRLSIFTSEGNTSAPDGETCSHSDTPSAKRKRPNKGRNKNFDHFDNSKLISMLVSDENILSASEDEDDDGEEVRFSQIDRDTVKVSNITIPSLYTPHTLITLFIMTIGLFAVAMLRNDSLDEHDNIHDGLIAVAFAFVLVGFLVCPNGPFTRPHPTVWQFVLSISIMYMCLMCFVLFQSYDGVKKLLYVLDPDLRNAEPDTKVYAVDCDKFSKFVESLDLFILAHFFGNVAKAMVLRHAGILWTLSIMWEITEVAFTHLLPNFAECWWDSYILDVLLCNGLGIYVGLKLCSFFEMRQYSWESFKAINGTKKKIERVILQFTPERWSQGTWIPKGSPFKRYIQLCLLIMLFQLNELNCFFLKHIFVVPSKHYFNFLRLSLILTLVAPSLRQYYVYISDSRCKRLGTHCWVFICITIFESLVCIKHGLPLFSKINLIILAIWIVLQFFICFLVLAISVSWVRIKSRIISIFDKSQVSRTTKNVLITAIHRFKH